MVVLLWVLSCGGLVQLVAALVLWNCRLKLEGARAILLMAVSQWLLLAEPLALASHTLNPSLPTTGLLWCAASLSKLHFNTERMPSQFVRHLLLFLSSQASMHDNNLGNTSKSGSKCSRQIVNNNTRCPSNSQPEHRQCPPNAAADAADDI